MTRSVQASILGLALAAHAGWVAAAGSGLLSPHMPQLLSLEQQKRI